MTYQVILIRPSIRLGDQNLNSKHRNDGDAQRQKRDDQERNLQQLPHDLLPPRKVVMFPPAFINVLIVILELGSVDLDMLNTLDVPAQTQIDLLNLPVLEENSAPDTGENAVREGVAWKPEPCDDACYGGEGEEEKIGLDESKVKSNLSL